MGLRHFEWVAMKQQYSRCAPLLLFCSFDTCCCVLPAYDSRRWAISTNLMISLSFLIILLVLLSCAAYERNQDHAIKPAIPLILFDLPILPTLAFFNTLIADGCVLGIFFFPEFQPFYLRFSLLSEILVLSSRWLSWTEIAEGSKEQLWRADNDDKIDLRCSKQTICFDVQAFRKARGRKMNRIDKLTRVAANTH
ncbi:hypothetical protein KP509_08G057400 [Ceratopteris richardii]|uniref:Uncharacterized protein n=1 Tax=Ceratopteris richardii TaxID=49495 RepID=A0A8T2UAB1_CERRI|nr:hypothetical protein KP509_08G057400 [Ceratopteris richardii]